MDKLGGFARKKRLGDLLVDAGVISQDQLEMCIRDRLDAIQGLPPYVFVMLGLYAGCLLYTSRCV